MCVQQDRTVVLRKTPTYNVLIFTLRSRHLLITYTVCCNLRKIKKKKTEKTIELVFRLYTCFGPALLVVKVDVWAVKKNIRRSLIANQTLFPCPPPPLPPPKYMRPEAGSHCHVLSSYLRCRILSFFLHQMEDHIDHECRKTVVDCPHKTAGCAFQVE